MTLKNDQFSADSLASAMSEVMQSSEHKEMFTKQAQVDMGFEAMPGANTSQTLTSMPGGAGTVNVMDPSNAGPGAIKSQVGPQSTVKSTTPVADVVGKLQALVENPALAGIHGTEAAGLAGKILAGTATSQELSLSNPAVKNMIAGVFGGKPESEKGILVALQETNKEAPQRNATASTNVVDTIIRIANYLDQQDMLHSSAAADVLLETIIVEAKKKAKEKKKLSKKMKKLEKKMKKDMPCEECPKCECEPCECE